MRREKNVFDDLGFSHKEAKALQMKATLHSEIVRRAKIKNYSQRQLEKMLGEPQPRVSDLLTGKISKFSLETLIKYAEALNLSPEIKTHAPSAALQDARA